MRMYKELLKELLESKKKYFVADCIDAEETIGYEPEQVSQMISESIEISPNLFAGMCEITEEHNELHSATYGYSAEDDIAWIYNPDIDMHYFYR